MPPVYLFDGLHEGVLRIKNHGVDPLVKGEVGPQFLPRNSDTFSIYTMGKNMAILLNAKAPAWIRVVKLVRSHCDIANLLGFTWLKLMIVNLGSQVFQRHGKKRFLK